MTVYFPLRPAISGPRLELDLGQFDKISILGLVPEFRAKFKAEICDRIYTDTSGVIFSPNHPDLYPNQLDCTIQIKLNDPQLKIQATDSQTINVVYMGLHGRSVNP